MADIRPFQAVFFNQDKIPDLSQVVCPPYDVISPERQQYYHQLSPYNFIHVLLPKDAAGEDKYRRAGEVFREWLADKILVQDSGPAVYFYSHQYKIKGQTLVRLGFVARLHLGNKDSAPFKHEYTHQKAKDDRYNLLKEVRANLSPIFVVFGDKKRIISTVCQKYALQAKPFLQVTDDEKNVHKIWRLDEPGLSDQIRSKMQNEDIFIADGHHRYEVACAWRDQMCAELGGRATGEESFNYTLAYFTNTDPRGLTILPIHRLLRLNDPCDVGRALEAARRYFDVEEVKDAARFFFLMEKSAGSEHVLGMYKDKKYWMLRLKNVKILDTLVPGKVPEYRSLDVSILNYLVFNKVFGLSPEQDDYLKFSAQAEELIGACDADPRAVAFFLNPVKMEQIIALALKGQRMPPKSTYFYPKVLSGLVINKFD